MVGELINILWLAHINRTIYTGYLYEISYLPPYVVYMMCRVAFNLNLLTLILKLTCEIKEATTAWVSHHEPYSCSIYYFKKKRNLAYLAIL